MRSAAAAGIAEPQQARQELAKVYDTLLPCRPGSFMRDDRWWDAVLYDPAYRRAGSAPLRCLLAEDASDPRGYALYAASPNWDEDGIPAGTIRIWELMAEGPAAAAALRRDLLSRDLTRKVVAENRPVDDPLLHLLADPRRARARFRDGPWIRLIDLPAALTRRMQCGDRGDRRALSLEHGPLAVAGGGTGRSRGG